MWSLFCDEAEDQSFNVNSLKSLLLKIIFYIRLEYYTLPVKNGVCYGRVF